jgi:ABC-type polar amino acid transport system ATPase subunit
VLDGIDIEIGAGQVYALLGPSGSGKTTLLRCINGLEQFDGGTIDVAGEQLGPGRHDAQLLKRVRARVGFVFQGYHLFPHLTAVENVALAPRIAFGTPAAQAVSDALALLDRMGLSHRAHARPPKLSGGEQQRVAIARALATRPAVILFDEPTAALDPERRKDIRDVLRDLARGGQTMVLVTHEVEFARETADEAALLDGGCIVERGPARELLTNPTAQRTRDFLRALGSDGGAT